MTVGEGTGLIGLIRSWLVDRPGVKLVAKLRDYGEPRPDMFIQRTGLYFDVEIHSTGAQPVHVLDVGLRLGNDTTVILGRVDKTLTRPEFETIHTPLEDLRAKVGTQVVTGLYATATPERTFRTQLPKRWRRFPHDLPPTEPGRDHGIMIA